MTPLSKIPKTNTYYSDIVRVPMSLNWDFVSLVSSLTFSGGSKCRSH